MVHGHRQCDMVPTKRTQNKKVRMLIRKSRNGVRSISYGVAIGLGQTLKSQPHNLRSRKLTSAIEHSSSRNQHGKKRQKRRRKVRWQGQSGGQGIGRQRQGSASHQRAAYLGEYRGQIHHSRHSSNLEMRQSARSTQKKKRPLPSSTMVSSLTK